MKAIIYTQYGPPDVLRLVEVKQPAIKENDVLVKVIAAAVNYSNSAFIRGMPFMVRMMGAGLIKPKYKILGSEIAGRVEAVGKNVTQFHPGDEVYGDLSDCGRGGYAEYVSVTETALALKPKNLNFEEAAAVPETAVVALQGLRDKGQIKPAQKVLIAGASGGIGTFAVQIAKSYDSEVTGVCSTRNLELVRSIGADHVIDYTREDFTRNGERYDLILATAGYRSMFDYARVLNPKGSYVVTGGSMTQVFQPMFLGPWLSLTQDKKFSNLLMKINQANLVFMKELIEAGKVKPVIDRCYTLSETADAMRYYQQGHARGKVIIRIEGG